MKTVFDETDTASTAGLASGLASPSRRNLLKAAGALTGLALTIGSSGLVMAADAAPAKLGADAMPGA